MEYTEDDYLMISGIQHFKFCRRQWALIHVEQQWAENVHTAVGKLMHQKVHDPYLTEKRKDTILVRALPVSSRIMGVSGECDLVEFHKCEDGIRLHGHRGMYSIYPVEYKKGKAKSTDADRLQLVAQVLCLEEMFSATIPEAALFYGETRRREVVEITEDLRNAVKDIFEEMHQYYNRGYTPKVKTGKMCNSCSLKELCLEELRAVLADRFVLSLVNKKIVNGKNFTKKENGAVLMDDELRKKLLVEWQKKKKETITHPFLKEKVEWGMVPYVQAMLLARYLRGDLDSYPVFLKYYLKSCLLFMFSRSPRGNVD